MGPSPLHRGREARASPQSPEAQGLWKVLPWDLGRDSGRMVFTGRAAGVGGAAAPTSCQNKDQDSECWVCPLWAAWYAPPSPNQGKATMRDRCAQVMVLQQPSWMCLPSRRPHKEVKTEAWRGYIFLPGSCVWCGGYGDTKGILGFKTQVPNPLTMLLGQYSNLGQQATTVFSSPGASDNGVPGGPNS